MTQTVSLTFGALYVESSLHCDYDSITIYDGADDRASLIGKYCGRRKPQTLTSSSSTVFIVFASDMDTNTGRFALSWQFNEGQSWLVSTTVRQVDRLTIHSICSVVFTANLKDFSCGPYKHLKHLGTLRGCDGQTDGQTSCHGVIRPLHVHVAR